MEKHDLTKLVLEIKSLELKMSDYIGINPASEIKRSKSYLASSRECLEERIRVMDKKAKDKKNA